MSKPCRGTLRLSVSEKLIPLTFLAGAEFIKAWLEVVKCTHIYPLFPWLMKIIFHCKVHALLCDHDIEYDDSPSLCNIMCNGNMKSGVLIDYDFWSSLRHPWVPQAGTNRTGTIPFMAVELLTDKYWNGSIERLYRHDLEAFIWILPFVFLRYQNGKSQRGTLVDQWMTSNYITCYEKKSTFQNVCYLKRSVSANPIW